MQPIVYDAAELELIEAFSALGTDAEKAACWSSDGYAPLRHRIKAHYILQQKRRCCYCQKEFMTHNNRVWDVEHILSRESFLNFMFIPLNLALSCPDCNIEKGSKKVYKGSAAKRYPTDSRLFIIVHPHFDDYDQHVFRPEHFYAPKSDKGRRTIEVCGLLRFAANFVDWPDPSATNEIAAILQSRGPGIAQRVRNGLRAVFPFVR